VLALAVALKKENPDRTAAQVTRILAAQSGAPTERTIQRHFELLELISSAAAAPRAARAALTGTPRFRLTASAAGSARSARSPPASSTRPGPASARAPNTSVSDAGIVPGDESGSLTTR
jgi:hypothetical protein